MYEKEPDQAKATPELVSHRLHGPSPLFHRPTPRPCHAQMVENMFEKGYAHALVCEHGEQGGKKPIGMALVRHRLQSPTMPCSPLHRAHSTFSPFQPGRAR